MKALIFVDGASRGNPGPAGIGVIIKKGKEILVEIGDYLGKTTNNVAEYLALIRGLEEALFLGIKEGEFFSDSELLVKQIKGDFKVKNEGLIPLYHHAQALIFKLKKFSLVYLKREENKRADQLANQAIDKKSLEGVPLFKHLSA